MESTFEFDTTMASMHPDGSYLVGPLVRHIAEHSSGDCGLVRGAWSEGPPDSGTGEVLRASFRGTPDAARRFTKQLGGLLEPSQLGSGSCGLLGIVASGRVPDEAAIRALSHAGAEVLDSLSLAPQGGRSRAVVAFRGTARQAAAAADTLGDEFRWSTHVVAFDWNGDWDEDWTS